MTVFEALLISGSAILGWKIGRMFRRRQEINQFAEEFEQQLKDKFNQMVIYATAERVGDSIYLYRAEDNLFICRGTTAKEIGQAAEDRFPGMMIVLQDDTDPTILAELGVVNQ